MDHGAHDIHDASAWDGPRRWWPLRRCLEKYEETHGGVSARTTPPRGSTRRAPHRRQQRRRTPRPAQRHRRRTPRRRRRRRRGWRLGRATTSRSSWRRGRDARARASTRGRSSTPPGCERAAAAAAAILAGRDGSAGSGGGRRRGAATAVSGAPSDQHEADLTNLILAWYHTGFFTAVYQERHGRR